MLRVMEEKKAASGDVIMRLVGPAAIWAITRLVEAPKVQKALKRVDRKLGSKTNRVQKRAASNRVWLAAGAAAFAIGISLLARAATRPK